MEIEKIETSVQKESVVAIGEVGPQEEFSDNEYRLGIDTSQQSFNPYIVGSPLRDVKTKSTMRSRTKSVQPMLETLPNLAQGMVERMSRIACKSIAYESTMNQTNGVFSGQQSQMAVDPKTSRNNSIANVSSRRWTIVPDISRRTVHLQPNARSSRVSEHHHSIKSFTGALQTQSILSSRPLINHSPLLSGQVTQQRFQLISDTNMQNYDDGHLLIQDDMYSTSPDFVSFSPAPGRTRLLPELNNPALDVTIYTPQQQQRAQNIIRKRIQLQQSDQQLQTSGSCLSQFSHTMRHGSPSSTTLAAFNTSFIKSKMPAIVQTNRIRNQYKLHRTTPMISDETSIKKTSQEVVRAHETFENFNTDQYGQTQQMNATSFNPSSKSHESSFKSKVATKPILNVKQRQPQRILKQATNFTRTTTKNVFFLERLQEQEEEELEPISVDQIMNEQVTRHDKLAQSGKHQRSLQKLFPVISMNEKSVAAREKAKARRFADTMPNPDKLEKELKSKISKRKEKLLNEVAHDSRQLEGMLSMNEAADRHKRKNSPSAQAKVSQYVQKFSQQIERDQQDDMIKMPVKKGRTASLNKKQAETNQHIREGSLPQVEKESKFEELFQRESVNEVSTLKKKADEVIQRIEYIERFKKRDMNEENKNDPVLKYFKRCKEKNSLLLPVFEKIYHKTLCLQNYVISEGQCEGVAEACKYIDSKHMNRVLFNNCGMTGNKMAILLEGFAAIKDFKSIIYKHNELNSLAVAKLEPLLLKQVPNHLSELQIIDCKIHCTVIEQLFDLLIQTDSKVCSFALVNVHHSEQSFGKLCKYVRGSGRLQELNVSWQSLRPCTFSQFLEVVKENRTLISLTIAWNTFLKEQSNVLTQEQIEKEIQEVPLSPENRERIDCFADFIKYNTHLVHLDLSNCGLIEPAVKYLVSFMTKAQALQCLHLTGNGGATNPATIDWITKRIHGVTKPDEIIIPPMNKEFATSQQTMQSDGTDPKLWKDIREGLKMREMVHSNRLNEQNRIDFSTSKSTLIIQRHLGLKELLPEASKWKICADEHSECWYCNYYILTFFVWVPQISQIGENKDPEVRRYYQSALDLESTRQASDTPRIAGSFNSWQSQPMQQIVPFVQKNDPSPPDFLELACDQGLVREDCRPGGPELQPPNAVELQKIDEVKNQYYLDNWRRVILKFTQYANPKIANANTLTQLGLDLDPQQPVYFYVAFLRPGRNSYVIQQKQDFHVHQMLTEFRSEDVPQHYNPRHVRQNPQLWWKDKHEFKNFKHEDKNLNFQLAHFDLQYINFKGIIDHNDYGSNREVENDQAELNAHLQQHTPLLQEIFINLQSKSGAYPLIDRKTFNEHFLSHVIMPDSVNMNALLNKVDESTNNLERRGPGLMCRATLIEVFLRLAKAIYFVSVDLDAEDVVHIRTPVAKAFDSFVKEKLQIYFLDQRINRTEFREEKLWLPQNDLVYSMNKTSIRAIQKQYNSVEKVDREEGLSPNDCVKLVCLGMDLRSDVSESRVRSEYALSKQLVVNEQDERAFLHYTRLNYLEFVEFIARISEAWFEGSEMAELPFYRKIEYFLERMLSLVGSKVIQQEIIIDEFSESDEEQLP